MIQLAVVDNRDRLGFLDNIFSMFLDYFSNSRILEIRLGVLYGLYLLFATQPDTLLKARIRVTLYTWNQLVQLEEKMIAESIADALYIFGWLKENHAFFFHCLFTE